MELDEFLKSFDKTKLTSNAEYKEIITELKEKKPIGETELPILKNFEFRDYQKEGIYWLNFLKKYNFGGILADEMGLGKTLQALSLLRMNIGENKTHIVLCPKSLILNWKAEAKKYYPELKVLVISQNSKKREEYIKQSHDYDIVITSYSMIQKDYKIYLDNEIKFEYMILDEAHYIKNIKTQSNKAVRIINSNRKVILTGTPLENNLTELYGTFEIIMPGFLGTPTEFRRDFISKIERNNRIALEILQARIRPLILRRTKKEVLKELPEKQEQIVYNEMTNKQSIVYKEILNRVKADVEETIEKEGERSGKSKIQILSALLRLRQICNHPQLVDPKLNEEDMSSKLNQFNELIDEIVEGGEKVLVFSQFTKMLDILQKSLEGKNIEFVRLDGSTKNRQEVVDNFNEDKKIKVFLISLKAGGVGLNLTSASSVFIYDPWWNPQAENQAIDRAHRIGQEKTVNVYKFITKNSIEEKILKLQERKGNLFDNIVTENTEFIKKLEWEDLLELFD
jgi:SNF2 family DNA or RNA helicase